VNIYTTDGPAGDARPVESARLVQVTVPGDELGNAAQALQAAAEGAHAIVGVRFEPCVTPASGTRDQGRRAGETSARLSFVVYGTALTYATASTPGGDPFSSLNPG
jgi:hypothetical protein